jgi:hypothetical protein
MRDPRLEKLGGRAHHGYQTRFDSGVENARPLPRPNFTVISEAPLQVTSAGFPDEKAFDQSTPLAQFGVFQ